MNIKKYFYRILLFLISVTLFGSCVDEQIVVDNLPEYSGKMVLDSTPKGAQIFFLGTNTGKITPDSIMNLESGVYDVTLRLEGYQDTTFNVTVLNKYKSSRMIEMLALNPAGSIIINSEPGGAQILLAGENTGKITPDSLMDVTPGIYFMTLVLNGYKDTTFNVTVQNSRKTLINVTLKDTLPPPDAAMEYRNIQFSQILFSFKFNQNINLEKIETRIPGADSTQTNDFRNELVLKEEERIMIFPQSSGTWNFTIYGNKAGGDSSSFVLLKSINVP